MTEIEKVFYYLKVFHYKPWDEDKLEECKKQLATLSREELRDVRHCRWMDKDNALYPALFELLYQNELKSVVKKLSEMTTPDLLQELKTTKSSYKKEKIPEILLERYDSMGDEERKQAFKLLLRKGFVNKSGDKQDHIVKVNEQN